MGELRGVSGRAREGEREGEGPGEGPGEGEGETRSVYTRMRDLRQDVHTVCIIHACMYSMYREGEGERERAT